MTEMQRLSPTASHTARHRSAHAGPHRLSLDETHDLRPHRTVSPPPATQEPSAEPRQAAPPLAPTEKAIRGVLLGGLALTAAVLATKGEALTPADILLGSTVLVAGAALLVVMELCRR